MNQVSLRASTLCLWLLPAALLAQWSEPSSEHIILRGGWLFDSISDDRRKNSGIEIRDGIFTEIDADPDRAVPATARLIELSDSDTIIPGMIDLHAHYNFDLVDRGRAEEVHYNGIIFLANGITSTWSAGEFFPDRVLKRREQIDNGKAIGPRLFASGPYFGAFRCEYQVKTAWDDCSAWPNDISEEEIRAEVDYWADQGVISIKVKQATPSEMEILIDQAHRRDMTVTGHLANYNVEYDVPLEDAILMGIDRIEHQITLGSGGPRSADMQDMINLMLEHQVFYDANLQMYGGINLRNELGSVMYWADEARFFTPYARGLLEKRGPPPPESDEAEFAQRMLEIRKFYESGGGDLLILGTDEPVYTLLLPGFAFHREMLAMKHAGLPAATILKAATINGARALGVADRLGSIEVGKMADLYVAEGNPLDDIKTARNVQMVIKSGFVYDPGELLESAAGKIGPTGPDDHARWELHVKPFRQ